MATLVISTELDELLEVSDRIGVMFQGRLVGLIDAAENNIPSYDGFKHYEAVKFYSKTEHSMAPEMLLMSKAVYDKLPAADQQMIDAPGLERVYITARDISAKADEAAEEQADVAGLHRHRIRSVMLRHPPAAFTHQPVHKRAHRIGERLVDLHAGDVAGAVRLRNGQGDQ